MSAILINNELYGVGGSGSTEIKTLTYEEYLANKEVYDSSGEVYMIPDYPISLAGAEGFTLIPASGVTINSQSCFYNPVSKLAVVVADLTVSPTVGTGVALCTVPTKYNPQIAMYGLLGKVNNTPVGTIGISINQNGQIMQWQSSACSQASFTITYPC